ncbi:MAG: hypothetical protein FLDDKLPJ_02937 [Phycisphaerae bacterium]|nr:hypothetical protein [Phycisphaerae bacterium]
MPTEPLSACPFCDYDLHGLPPRHRCPECGFEYDEHTRVWRARRQWTDYLAPVLVSWIVAQVATGILVDALVGGDAYPLVLKGLAFVAFGLAAWSAVMRLIRTKRATSFVALTDQGVVYRTAKQGDGRIGWNKIASDPGVDVRHMPELAPHLRIWVAEVFGGPLEVSDFNAWFKARLVIHRERIASSKPTSNPAPAEPPPSPPG